MLVPAAVVLSAPTVHLQQSGSHEASAVPGSVPNQPAGYYGSGGAYANDPASAAAQKPHIVEPTWITVTMPPLVYNPSDNSVQPPVMQPYFTYVPIQQQMSQPWTAPWHQPPYPNMGVQPAAPLGNPLCNQQPNAYRAY